MTRAQGDRILNPWVRAVVVIAARVARRVDQIVKKLLRPARTATTLAGTADVDAVRPRAQLVAENTLLRQLDDDETRKRVLVIINALKAQVKGRRSETCVDL